MNMNTKKHVRGLLTESLLALERSQDTEVCIINAQVTYIEGSGRSVRLCITSAQEAH